MRKSETVLDTKNQEKISFAFQLRFSGRLLLALPFGLGPMLPYHFVHTVPGCLRCGSTVATGPTLATDPNLQTKGIDRPAHKGINGQAHKGINRQAY